MITTNAAIITQIKLSPRILFLNFLVIISSPSQSLSLVNFNCTTEIIIERIKINTAIVQEYPIFKDEKAVLYNVSPVKYVLVPGPPFVIV